MLLHARRSPDEASVSLLGNIGPIFVSARVSHLDVGERHLLASMRRVLSSDAKCNTPCRSGIGLAVQVQWECCHAILFARFGRGKRPN